MPATTGIRSVTAEGNNELTGKAADERRDAGNRETFDK